jgi:hypothetical protein
MAARQDGVLASALSHDGGDTETAAIERRAEACEDIANLKSDLAYLRRQVHGLRAKFHGELAVLALRIEDNERRAMRRRKAGRKLVMAAVVATWLLLTPSAVLRMLNGPFLRPGLLLVGMTLVGGLTLVILNLHNEADEQDYADRYRNWFRLTGRDDL